MSFIFWESVQKARGTYFCDYCCNYIEPGETYERRVMQCKSGDLFVLREHHYPSVCPPNEMEEEMLRELDEERAALGVPIALEFRVEQMVAIATDGSTFVESRSVLVPRAAPTIAARDDHDYNEEFPF